jgi:rfaE bifunctional protein kinase chain/domain
MNITESFKGVRVLVIGDVMLDRYWWGTVDRISPEAPVPIVRLGETTLAAGGAANVAANIAGLGAEPLLLGISGDDADADLLSDALSSAEISADYLIRSNRRPTTLKTRIVAHGQHVVRIDQETNSPIDEDLEDRVKESAAELIEAGLDSIVVSDYAKGMLSTSVLSTIFDAASRAGTRVFVDPKGHDYLKYRGASVITPNRLEAATACGLDPGSPDLVSLAGTRLMDEIRGEAVLITEGEHGMTLFCDSRTPVHFDSSAREVFDVTGAGDTVIATFATAAGSGSDLLEAANLANIAAGIVVASVGTTRIDADDLNAAYGESSASQ